MDEQPPKPRRDWRSFGKEYVIVVLGVATALAAQQAADWLHWRGEVKTARKAIHAEIGLNNSRLFTTRLGLTPCLERQADEAGSILDDLEAKRLPRHFTTFHPGFGAPPQDSDWEAERSAQSLTHFPRDELALMGRYYIALENFRGWEATEREAWRTLSVLRQPPKEIDRSDLLRLRAALMTARDTARLITLNAVRQINLTNEIGATAVTPERDRVEKFCTLDYEAFNQWSLALAQRQ